MKVSEIEGEGKKDRLCGVFSGHAGGDADYFQE
jgi:hypothetical protein